MPDVPILLFYGWLAALVVAPVGEDRCEPLVSTVRRHDS
jgi:hypothetical protein